MRYIISEFYSHRIKPQEAWLQAEIILRKCSNFQVFMSKNIKLQWNTEHWSAYLIERHACRWRQKRNRWLQNAISQLTGSIALAHHYRKKINHPYKLITVSLFFKNPPKIWLRYRRYSEHISKTSQVLQVIWKLKQFLLFYLLTQKKKSLLISDSPPS